MKNSLNKDQKSILVYASALVLILVVSLGYKYVLSGRNDSIVMSNDESLMSTITSEDIVTSDNSIVNSEQIAVESSSQTESTDSNISVYICGAVNSAGVYEIPRGSILNMLIDMADGFKDEAATDYINLVFVLEDNISIYIPYYEDIRNSSILNENNSDLIRCDQDIYVWGEGTPYEFEDNSNSDVSSDVILDNESDKININNASINELMMLPGIGEVMAQNIISYREGQPFINIEDIMNVTGIGETRFEAIRNLICV